MHLNTENKAVPMLIYSVLNCCDFYLFFIFSQYVCIHFI